jgi:hypothetical protein
VAVIPLFMLLRFDRKIAENTSGFNMLMPHP